MEMPAQHVALLQRANYPVPSSARLNEQERGLLSRYGYWLEALATGTITPITPDQKHFVDVAKNEAEPHSPFEVAWVKCHQSTVASAQPDRRELAHLFNQLIAARTAAATTKEDYSARRVAILELVREQLDALDAEFVERLANTEAEATRLEAEARQAVVAHGASFWHLGVHAVYTRSRVTWDGKGLAAYAEAHPEIGQFRRIGQPSVSLRFKQPDRPVDGTAVAADAQHE